MEGHPVANMEREADTVAKEISHIVGTEVRDKRSRGKSEDPQGEERLRPQSETHQLANETEQKMTIDIRYKKEHNGNKDTKSLKNTAVDKNGVTTSGYGSKRSSEEGLKEVEGTRVVAKRED